MKTFDNLLLMPKISVMNLSRNTGKDAPLRKRTVTTQAEKKQGATPLQKEKITLRAAIKLLVWVSALSVICLSILNWGFISARVSFFLHKPNSATVIRPKSEPVLPLEGSWPKDTLAIPSLGISAPVIYNVEQSEDAFQVALQRGVVHYPGSGLPGEVGNVYIFGHSSDYAWSKGEFKSVFAVLPKIEKGAEIKLTDSKGFMYTYLVTNQFVVGPKDVSVLSQDTKGKRMLTVQTSYPIGTALKRYVVQAELRQSD